MKNKKLLSAIMGLMLVVLLGLSVGNVDKVLGNKPKEDKNQQEDKAVIKNIEEPELEKTKTIEIVATGDVLIHKEILDTQYDATKDSYDFNNNFQYIKSYLENADLTISNLETTLAGKENYGYSGYPSFNSPDSLADAMKIAGIDVVANMNNHALDRDVKGYKRTRQTLVDKGFDVIGTRATDKDKRYVIKDVKGIKMGITSYGYTMTGEDNKRGLNGIVIPQEILPLMNSFHPDNLNWDLENMKEQIANMKADGAEVIVFYMHWGDEYELEPNAMQVKIAQFLADEKVDIIFGTHPHSLQPIDILKSSDGKSETPVIYSMGNFLSSQRTERIQNPYTEDGVIVSVNITKNLESNEIVVETPTYIPTWVNWYEKKDKLFYEVVPATINDAGYLTEEGKKRVVESYNRTKGVIEKYNDKIKVKE
ncbi:CapA family protein [Clostridium gasigenes]|uniref:CapA family protein n=1 Tax=Clostridium gasigenes TaxID=94869 RepID=UPI001438676D|nr:CapA family protein [Clostridium gasigenes]NKF08020.1 CapA family protein [Clostridium gasigenes]QSW20604.1 CapA family protein [Clostridium gasigenes]